MLKIEFPAENKKLAAAIGKALTQYAGSEAELVLRVDASDVSAQLGRLTAQSAANVATHSSEPDTTTGADDEPTNDAPADGRKDQKGVVFNPTFCANAKEPFYSSGAMLGQWKKARGCDQGAYDAWYANEHAKAQAAWHEKADSLGIQTGSGAAAAAFAQGTAVDTTPAKPAAPTTGGELMKWVSERQAANVLTQADIDGAWAVTGFGVADLFGPNSAAVIASVHGILSAKAGA